MYGVKAYTGMNNARALWFDGCPVIITEDWQEVRLDYSWEEAIDEWRKTHAKVK
jgi:hypothetical protein